MTTVFDTRNIEQATSFTVKSSFGDYEFTVSPLPLSAYNRLVDSQVKNQSLQQSGGLDVKQINEFQKLATRLVEPLIEPQPQFQEWKAKTTEIAYKTVMDNVISMVMPNLTPVDK